MTAVRIHFKVRDYAKWKQTFDEDVKSGLLFRAGILKYTLHRLPETGDPTLYLEAKDSKQLQEFFDSDVAKGRMKEASIEGIPRFEYLDKIEENRIGPPAEKAA